MREAIGRDKLPQLIFAIASVKARSRSGPTELIGRVIESLRRGLSAQPA